MVLLSQLQDDKYNAVVERIAKKLTEAYPNSRGCKEFQYYVRTEKTVV